MDCIPGLPGAPQDEAGLTRKFETSHVGFRVLLWLERDSSRKDGRSASQRSGQAVGVLGKFPQAPPRWKARYTSLGDRALWDRLGGTQPQHTRQRAFWISWFLKAYMTGLMMEL